MRPTTARRLLPLAAVPLLAQAAGAQTLPYLPDAQVQALAEELSGDRSFEHIRWVSHWHRDSGMDGYFKAADYVVQAAKDAGLQNVRFVEQVLDGPNYTPRSAELWLEEPVRVKLADLADHATHLADGSRDADVRTEVVWIGDASEEAMRGLDVRGKIVLTSANPGVAVNRAVYERGAVGVISYASSEGKSAMDFPDQIAWSRISLNVPAGKQGTFAFMLPPRRGDMLRRLLEARGPQDVFATGTRTPGGRAVVRARVDTEVGGEPGRTGFVEGIIPGAKYPDQQIVITAHLQEEQGSANDDGSGVGNLLEIARTINKLVAEGRLPRPLRPLRFWWTDEIYSEYRWFRDHPEETRKILANVHQDMVGANQAMESRVQHLILAPHSRTSYLDAVYEGVGNYLILTNNGFLAASRQGGLPRPHTRPIYATRGSRQGYNARFVPWFGNSDHAVFLDGPINIPAVAAINWDDAFIHSSDDDLFQIDQTQLERNAFLTAATALALAYAEADDVPMLLAETQAQGSRRLANDLMVAMRLLDDTSRPEAERWKDAAAMIGAGVDREARALGSVRVFAAGDAGAGRRVEAMVQRARAREAGMMEELVAHAGGRRAEAPLTEAERAAGRKVPANVASLETYFANRAKVPATPGLHGLMRNEVFNFVDGRRSYYDIFRAVRAESMAAGDWYYGTVTLEDVVKVLDGAVAAGALTLR